MTGKDDGVREESTHSNTNHGRVYGLSIMARDIYGDVAVTYASPPRSKTDIALDEATAQLRQSLRKQWSRESERQRLWVPDPLKVHWRLSPDDSDQWPNIRRSQDDAPPPPRGELRRIVDLYDKVPSGRLVVLGQAGSGKSVLAIRLLLDLLNPLDPLDRPAASATPVPVIFGLGSWYPDTPLREWLASRLKRDHPGLAAPGPGSSTLAAALVDHRRILPVLDGFDEIAEDRRRTALKKLNDTASSGMPLLLTSRPDEYATAAGLSGVLTAAAAIRLDELSLDALEKYLPLTTTRTLTVDNGTDIDKAPLWEPVLKHLRDAPEGSTDAPLATVLRTPLMVTLARTIYSDAPDRDPRELLDTDRFNTTDTLQNHLLDNFVAAVYRDESDDYRARAQGWLGHLAGHLKALDTHDLKWWQLGSTLSRPVRLLAVGLVAGLTFGLLDALAVWCVAGFAWQSGPARTLLLGLMNGAVFGLVSGLAFGLVHVLLDGSAARDPSRVRIRLLGRSSRSPEAYVPRLVVGATGGAGFGFVSWLVSALFNGLLRGWASLALLDGVVSVLVSGLALGLMYAGGASAPGDEPLRFVDGMREFRQRIVPRLAIGYAGGFGVGFVFWTVSPLAISLVLGFEGPFTSLLVPTLKLAFMTALWYGAVVGLVFGLAVPLVDPIRISSAVSPSQLLKTDRMSVVHQLLLSMLAFGLLGALAFAPAGRLVDWIVFTLVGGFGSGLAYGLSLTAWGHWVVLSRVWLPLTGRLPWAVNAFLEDAHRKGVLRQAGAVYQFRHARLRDRLAEMPKAAPPQ